VAYFLEDDARLFTKDMCSAEHRDQLWQQAPADTFLLILGGHHFGESKYEDSWSLPRSQIPPRFQAVNQSFGTYGFVRCAFFSAGDYT
jgi:hypothetical protein